MAGKRNGRRQGVEGCDVAAAKANLLMGRNFAMHAGQACFLSADESGRDTITPPRDGGTTKEPP
jgi:hypothetical protein